MDELSIISTDGRGRLFNSIMNEIGDIETYQSDECLKIKTGGGHSRIRIANAITVAIIERYQAELIRKIINIHYNYFSTRDKQSIFESAVQYIENENDIPLGKLLAQNRANIVMQKVAEYLESCNEMVVDGFVNFRLREYISELEEVVDKCVDEFLLEREYREYIHLLRYFVELTPSTEELVHIVVSRKGYRLLDGRLNDITAKYLCAFPPEGELSALSNNDILVSALISIAPLKIKVHGCEEVQNLGFFNAIYNIFEKRVELCEGCDLCKY